MTLPRRIREARRAAAELEHCSLMADVACGDYRDAASALVAPLAALSSAIRNGAARLARHGIVVDPAQIAAEVVDAADPLRVIQERLSRRLRDLAEQIRSDAKL